MAFMRRISDNFWSYVSPQKPTNAQLPTPKTMPRFKKPGRPANDARLKHLARRSRSMSLGERVGNWRLRSPSSEVTSTTIGRKRRRQPSYSPSAGRLRKTPRMDGDEMDVNYDDQDNDTLMDEYGRTPTARGFDDDDSMALDNSLVVDETPVKRRPVNLPEYNMRHISTEELRGKGWDDDYITVIQKIAMRGYEPLLPQYMMFEYKNLPDGLFEFGDDAFVASVRKDHFKSGKALEQLLELGSRVRDRAYMQGPVEPEEQVRRQIKAYLKWAFEDAGIDRSTYIPILAIETKPAGTEATTLRANATRKCRRLAARYRQALEAERSVELSPTSRSSKGTLLSYPLPTIYAIVASHEIVALMAYKSEAEDPVCTPIAFFDMKDKDYDVWNSLALAIMVCHVRNVHMRIAEDTGLGLKMHGYSDEEIEEDDPDL